MHSVRPWIGIALLAVSWLFGLDYYELPSFWAQAAAVVAGVYLLSASERSNPFRETREAYPELTAAIVLCLLPVLWWTPWPYRIAPLLIVSGLLLERLPLAPRLLRPIAAGWTVGGAILMLQAVTLTLYAAATARNHDVPGALVKLLSGLCSLAGIDSAGDGPILVMQSMRQPIRLAITWDMLCDSATMMFLVGGLAWIAVWKQGAGSTEQGPRQSAYSMLRAPRSMQLYRFALVVLAWLPIRAVLMVALYLHRVALSDPNYPLHVGNQFLSSWIFLALLASPVLLAWRFVCLRGAGVSLAEERETPRKAAPRLPSRDPLNSISVKYLAAAACCIFGAILVAVGLQWEPVGARKAGRVMFVERHAPWSPSDRPYDTAHFGGGDAEGSVSYTYTVAYHWLSQYYDMSRLQESDAIDDQTLAGCDVLVIKIPRVRYSPEEVEAVVRFVNRGGGLLLIGDHTNLDGSSAHMNDISRAFGFTFRDDVLYSTQRSPYDEHYTAPLAPHPAIEHVPAFDFAVSCSIDPGYSLGRPVVTAAGLWSMDADYSYENYMPEPQHTPGMRFGSFIQAWATHAGSGRVLAWGDSTIFSSFCIGQSGKFPVLLNAIEWLDHQGGTGIWWLWTLLGAATIVNGLRLIRSGKGDSPIFAGAKIGTVPSSWLVLLAATACGWTLGTAATSALLAHEMPLRKPAADRRLPLVVIDRNTSRAPLATGFQNDDANGQGFGLLEQWIPRLGDKGYMTMRGEGDAVFQGDAIVMLYPRVPIGEAFRRKLVDYVERGGRLLVIDAGFPSVPSTSNQILQPFGMSLDYATPWQGQLEIKDRWPRIEVASAWEVRGGQSFATLNGERPVCATASFGQGLVMVVSCGTLFNDFNMGNLWSKDPTPAERTRYDVLFAILRRLVQDEMPVAPAAKHTDSLPRRSGLVPARRRPSPPAQIPIPSPDVPLKLPEPRDSNKGH